MGLNAIKTSLLIFIIAACSNCQMQTEIESRQPVFFDLNDYFDSQLELLSHIKSIRKTTSVDSLQMEKDLDSIDISTELAAFRESDINKVAWIGRYRIDSLYNSNGDLIQVDYIAKDEKLRTQRLSVAFRNSIVDTVKVYNNTSGAVAKLEQHLLYIPGSGYSIRSIQKTTLSKDHVLTVDVKFLE